MSINLISQEPNRESFEKLSDRKMKLFLEQFLIFQGWSLEIDRSSKNKMDIEARRGVERWHIHIKGVDFQAFEPIDLFLSALGDILMRMDSPEDKYSIAVPNSGSLHKLWKRLPSLVKKRTGITALFVSPSGFVKESSEE
jgi:hypothetical protein